MNRAAMSPYSLTLRLALLLAALSFAVLGLVGAALYNVLAMQLRARDDAALIARVEQVRALLKDNNTLDLIHNKPRLFANMLGNRESMLVLRYPGQPPLIEVNPLGSAMPPVRLVHQDASITLQSVAHTHGPDGVPVSSVGALAQSQGAGNLLEVSAARTMYDRVRLLQLYRERNFCDRRGRRADFCTGRLLSVAPGLRLCGSWPRMPMQSIWPICMAALPLPMHRAS